jgi:hypothetical protein
MARRAELPVTAGRRDFAEQVLVHVALGVAIVHFHPVELVDHLGKQRRRRDAETRLAHVTSDGGFRGDDLADERENVLVHNLEHVLRLEQL